MTLFLLIGIFLITYDEKIINLELFFLSFILFIILTTVFLKIKDKYTPIIFFSVLFYGYSFSGIYFSFYENIYNARFFNEVSNQFYMSDFIVAMYSIIFGYLFFLLGSLISKKITIKSKNFDFNFINFDSLFFRILLIILFIIGFIYWLYLSFTIADGPIDLLSKIGIFHAILKEGITTLPYHLSYIGSCLLFLIYLHKYNKIPLYVKIIIFLTFLMLVSKARLSAAVFYLASFFIMYAIYNKIKFDIKKIFYIILFFIFLGALYMMRFYSNMEYIGKKVEIPILELLGILFFGRTNIGDLQSIVFSYLYTDDYGYLFGQSFFDFTRYWLNKSLFLDLHITSIGMRLKEVYFDHVSGAPAPGIISEMILNFGIFGITFGMFFLGAILQLFAKIVNPHKSLMNLFIYTKFLFLVLILPKVDSTVIQGFIWALLPIYLFIFTFIFIKTILIKGHKR
ncbi:O-antigen polymerase [Sulfurimonas sp. NWX79]|uniref:O-antigen polymerase n=1 Tax=Sulfurimonas sp. NWX79 TaxID=2925412 RepID=UPI003204A044